MEEEGQGHPPEVGGEHRPQPIVSQHAARPNVQVIHGAGPEQGGAMGAKQEEERRRELAEEEMEQAGQPQRLEESEQLQEEGEEPDENALDRDKQPDAQVRAALR